MSSPSGVPVIAGAGADAGWCCCCLTAEQFLTLCQSTPPDLQPLSRLSTTPERSCLLYLCPPLQLRVIVSASRKNTVQTATAAEKGKVGQTGQRGKKRAKNSQNGLSRWGTGPPRWGEPRRAEGSEVEEAWKKGRSQSKTRSSSRLQL